MKKVLSTMMVFAIFNPLIAFAGDRNRFPRNMTCRSCVQETIAPRPPQTPPPRTQPSQPTPPRTQPTPPRPPRNGR